MDTSLDILLSEQNPVINTAKNNNATTHMKNIAISAGLVIIRCDLYTYLYWRM